LDSRINYQSRKLKDPEDTSPQGESPAHPWEKVPFVPETPDVEEQERAVLEQALSEAAREGDVDGALQTLELMREKGIERSRLAWTKALEACRNAHRAEDALLLLEKMVADGNRLMPNHLSDVIEACRDEPHQALQLFNDVKTKYGVMPNALMYMTMVGNLLAGGYREEAAQVYGQGRDIGFFDPWFERGHGLDVEPYSIQVAKLVVEEEVKDRAIYAANGGLKPLFSVFVGYDVGKKKAIDQVLKKKFGLKTHTSSAKKAKLEVKPKEVLIQLGERLLEEQGLKAFNKHRMVGKL